MKFMHNMIEILPHLIVLQHQSNCSAVVAIYILHSFIIMHFKEYIKQCDCSDNVIFKIMPSQLQFENVRSTIFNMRKTFCIKTKGYTMQWFSNDLYSKII